MLTPRARGKERGEGKLVREQEAAVEVGVASSGGSRISTDAQSRRESGRSRGLPHVFTKPVLARLWNHELFTPKK